MKINPVTLAELASALSNERRRQKLSREDAAAVCGVSTSFIRDAESNPENCTLGKLAKLINGLGLSLEVGGLDDSRSGLPELARGQIAAAIVDLHQADFGVPDSQLVERAKGGLSNLIPHEPNHSTTGLASLVAQHGIKVKSKGEPT